jgi:amino acid permease
MRRMLSNIVSGGGAIASFVLAGLWIYFFWGFDWGRGRHWNMMMVVFVFGTFAIVILGGLFSVRLGEQIAPHSSHDRD